MKKMDLRHTGSDVDLLYISTPKFDFSIKGNPYHPNVGALNINENVRAKIYISCTEYTAKIYSPIEDKLVSYTGDSYPLFYEQQNYEIVIEKKTDDEVSFWHENINIRNKVRFVGASKRVLSGIINFKNDIGYSELIMLVNNREYLKVTIEVFPSKIDYQKDYYDLLQDINNELYNLIFDFYKRTYFYSMTKNKVGNSLTEFFAIINQVFDKLNKSIVIVLNMPHHVLKKDREILKYYTAKRVDREGIKWINKHPQYVKNIDGEIIVDKVCSVKSSITYDTYENRLVKYIIKSIIKKLNLVKKNYEKESSIVDENIKKSIEAMIYKLGRHLNYSFLKGVGDIYTMNSLSLVLNMAPGYKDVYKYYIMLLKGLMIREYIFKISMKDLAILYEYWCFIKLNSILREKYSLVKQGIIKFNNRGLTVTLTKGEETRVEYQNPKNGEIYSLVYNKKFKYDNIPTTPQMPDSILSLSKVGSNTIFKYVLDAKYKINPAVVDTDYYNKYRSPGPEEEDINTMHRYRDAIVYENKNNKNFERMVFGAFVLFPYSDEEKYKEHHFYKSIEKVNVGGLPFLPGSTKLVEKLIDDLINNSFESAFEDSVFQGGTYEYLDQVKFDDKEVLVAPLSSKEQLDINLKYNFYHIPYKNIKSSGIKFKYVAIYQSIKKFDKEAGIHYYGRIKGFEIVKRKDIKEIPKDSDELYVKFEIEEWNKLERPITCGSFGVTNRIYTNLFLLKNAKNVSELCIKTKEDYRLYLELKRLYEHQEEFLKVNINSKMIDENTKITGFKIGNLTIFINEGYYNIYKDDILRDKIPIEEFSKRPNAIIKRIRNKM
nr:DUF2357 domain-containing protein [Thermoanaerobacter thermohydrosulfuricus]